MSEEQRIELATKCTDCASMPKVPDAGVVFDTPSGSYQIMHNGIKTYTDSHYGPYNVEVIRRLQGIHEPQEEFIFDQVMRKLPPGGTILELGSFWAYYSLWFLDSIPEAKAFMVEPLEQALNAGKRNFTLNGRNGVFIQAAISDQCEDESEIELWPGRFAYARKVSVDSLMSENSISKLTILHADIQGTECKMLQGASLALREKRIQWIFISTHGENIHQQCLALLRMHRYNIVAEHTPRESYSVDGLIVASSDAKEKRIRISKNRTSLSHRAKIRAFMRVRILEPLGLKPVTS